MECFNQISQLVDGQGDNAIVNRDDLEGTPVPLISEWRVRTKPWLEPHLPVSKKQLPPPRMSMDRPLKSASLASCSCIVPELNPVSRTFYQVAWRGAVCCHK